MSKVFVYGSLKRGFGNHGLLETSEYIGKTYTPPDWTMYSLGGFPCIVPNGQTQIQGEVYEVTPETMKRLDYLEGYPGFYDRKVIETEFGDCWVYFIHDSENRFTRRGPVVESGVWERH